MNRKNAHFIFEGSKIGKVEVDAPTVADAIDALLDMIVASRISVHHISREVGSCDEARIYRDEKEKELYDTVSIAEMTNVEFGFLEMEGAE